MLGSGAGKLNTGLVRHMTQVTPSAPGKTKRKEAKKAKGGKLDEVVRDELGALTKAMVDADEHRGSNAYSQEECELPAGHRAGLRVFEGAAFRTNARGKLVLPSFSDVCQGNLSDAWLLSAFAAVAHVHPGAIVELFLEVGDGTFHVQLGEELCRVVPAFPAAGYADPLPGGYKDTLWVALLEKAFAQLEAGSYAFLECGNPSRALEKLTHKRAKRYAISEHRDPNKLGQVIMKAYKNKQPMVLRTKEGQLPDPFIADHAYAVLGAEDKNGKLLVKLYNPWGTKRGTRAIESVVHEVTLDTLVRSGVSLHVAGR